MKRQQQVLLRPAQVSRRHPPRERRRVGEVAGNATAECAAVCCCIPCTVMDMVVLAAYKVPAGLLKKAMHKRKRRLQKKKTEKLLDQRPSSVESGNIGPTLEEQLAKEVKAEKAEPVGLEEQMWAQFSGTGFWRSSSQRQQQQPQLQTVVHVSKPLSRNNSTPC
ncbi:uncharacterized protein LOC133304337 [Gastrolobium bilobum]|uniref:uncharacterized protein LOC133304337 n=1 Tax=Gastrolobium bilobum TaxID=150636 RepID=UPI002AB12A05|nr:uncharacterized protein LOC133304337 [Gastrolobium bilobum]